MLKDYLILNDFRLEAATDQEKPSCFARETYIRLDQKNFLYAIHPQPFSSPDQYIFHDFPTPKQWHEIFALFALNDAFDKACYMGRLLQTDIIQSNAALQQSCLETIGYSKERLDDLFFLLSADKTLQKLFREKKIPLKILRLLDLADPHWPAFSKVLLKKELNSNYTKEILFLWLDLEPSQKKLLQEQLDGLLSKLLPDSKGKLAENIYRNIHAIRFPNYHNLITDLQELLEKLPREIKTDFDPLLENKALTLSTSLQSAADLLKFRTALNQPENLLLLDQIIKKLNST